MIFRPCPHSRARLLLRSLIPCMHEGPNQYRTAHSVAKIPNLQALADMRTIADGDLSSSADPLPLVSLASKLQPYHSKITINRSNQRGTELLPTSTTKRIWKGEYTDLRDLLPSQLGVPELTFFDLFGKTDKEWPKKHIKTIQEWVLCFKYININYASSSLRAMKKTITPTDQCLMLKEACKYQSVSLASEINRLQVWKAARDKAHFGQRSRSCWLSLSLEGENNSPIPVDNFFSATLLKIMPLTLAVSWLTFTHRTLILTLTPFIVWDHLSLHFIPLLNFWSFLLTHSVVTLFL